MSSEISSYQTPSRESSVIRLHFSSCHGNELTLWSLP